jgi:S-DNA-T family DNA segregation ATPase FtsK/SpoIIIE
MRRREWTDPAPLEVERPRLPWWTMLPKQFLMALTPIILLAAAVWLAVFLARRLYRYPLAITGSAVLVGLGLGWSWWAAAGLPVLVGVGCGLWAWYHRDSFDRTVLRQARSEWRRLTVYAPQWQRTLRFSDLYKRAGHTVYLPKLRRVRSDGWRDRVSIKLLPGQCPTAYERHAEELAHSFGARSCRVRVEKPRRLCLDLVHSDPLARPLDVPALADYGTAVDLRRLVVGRSETGRDWRVTLLGSHLLVAGATGAGKASVGWSLLWALAPGIRAGTVQVFGIDPKGGMELGKAPRLFHRLVRDNGEQAVELIEHVATLTRQRAEALARSGHRKWSADSGQPFVLLLVDELADLIAYQPDRKLRERANLALQVICSQGRAPGVAVVGELQDPRKEVLGFRHLFPSRIALRLDEPTQVDMVLGEGVRDRGAAAHHIEEATPGIAWVKVDGRREPDRVRAFHVTDADLDALSDYVRAGDAPRQLSGTEAA